MARNGAARLRKPWLFGSLGGALGSVAGDLLAGATLAAIAIPEQMATARLGDFPPAAGFLAFIASALAFAAFGASGRLSVGADSTITPIFAGALGLFAAAGPSHIAGLASMLALLVGALLFLGGVFRLGWVADLLSTPVTTGFLAGIAIHIAVGQTPQFLGLPPAEGDIFRRLSALVRDIGEYNPPTAIIGAATLAFIVVAERISARIPAPLFALAAAALATRQFHLDARGVETLGAVASVRPSLSLPDVSFGEIRQLFGLAFVIAVVVMMQTAATTRSFPDDSGQQPDVDRDFVGLGAANLLSALFGAFPVNASPPRTAIVAETGGRSQMASLWAALAVLGVGLFGGSLLATVPEASLAAVLLFVAGRIFRLKAMVKIGATTKTEFALMAATLLAVAALPVQTGVGLAITLSLIHGVWTTTRARLIMFERLPGETVWWPENPQLAGETIPGVLVVGFQAPLSFLNAWQFAQDLNDAVAHAGPGLRLIVLEASSIVEIDYTAATVLAQTIDQLRAAGFVFAIARLESVRAQAALTRFGVLDRLGTGRLFHSVDEATRRLAQNAPD